MKIKTIGTVNPQECYTCKNVFKICEKPLLKKFIIVMKHWFIYT